MVNAVVGRGWDYLYLGQFEKSLEFFDKAICLSPHDPILDFFYTGKRAAISG